MKIERTWKPVYDTADSQEYVEHCEILGKMALEVLEFTNKRWEFGTTAFFEAAFLCREERKRLQKIGREFFAGVKEDEKLQIPQYLFGIPFKENRNLPEYAFVLYYEGKEDATVMGVTSVGPPRKRRDLVKEDSMEKETRTYCVDTEEGTHEYVAAGYNICEGYLTIYDKDRNVATYSPLVWTMIWEKDRCKVP